MLLCLQAILYVPKPALPLALYTCCCPSQMARMQGKLQRAPANVKLKEKHNFTQDCHHVELPQVPEKAGLQKHQEYKAYEKTFLLLSVASDCHTSLGHCQDTIITQIGPCSLKEEHRGRPILGPLLWPSLERPMRSALRLTAHLKALPGAALLPVSELIPGDGAVAIPGEVQAQKAVTHVPHAEGSHRGKAHICAHQEPPAPAPCM